MTQRKGFYVVWNPAGCAPVYQHATYDLALAEAKRLARCNPGNEFIVLGAMMVCVRSDVSIEQFDTSRLEIPF